METFSMEYRWKRVVVEGRTFFTTHDDALLHWDMYNLQRTYVPTQFHPTLTVEKVTEVQYDHTSETLAAESS